MRKNYFNFGKKFYQLNKALRQLKQLKFSGGFTALPYNKRRSLVKRIQRLYRQLTGWEKFTRLKPAIVAALLAVGFSFGSVQDIQAQIEFDTPNVNAFGFTPVSEIPIIDFQKMVDLDADGDLDIFSETLFVSLSGEYSPAYVYYENIGTPTEANFTDGVVNPFGLNNSASSVALPTMVDLDGDGDFDMLSTLYDEESGGVGFIYFENTGSPSSPEFGFPDFNPFGLNFNNLPGVYISHQQFVDMDGDGDLDMTTTVYGEESNLYYFKNIGEVDDPVFAPPISAAALNIDPDLLEEEAVMGHAYADLDQDGDEDLLMYNLGDDPGDRTAFYFEKLSGGDNISFAPPQLNPFGITPSSGFSLDIPDFADLDADGDLDLTVSSAYNGISFYENISVIEPQPPQALDNLIEILEDETYTFSSEDFPFQGFGNDEITSILIVSLPQNGTLLLDGEAVMEGQEIAVDDIENLTFVPEANAFGGAYATIVFTVNNSDFEGEIAGAISINVQAVFDPPLAIDSEVTVDEDSTYTFTSEDFGFETIEGTVLDSIAITSLPDTGSLLLDGEEVILGNNIGFENIANLTFAPNADEFGEMYASFGFTVNDGNGNSENEAIMTINVNNVNDAPSFTVEVVEESICSYTENYEIPVTDLSSGVNEMDGLEINVEADNPDAVDNINVLYTEGDSTASVQFTPTDEIDEIVTLTISVSDGQDTTTQELSITVEPCLGIDDLSYNANFMVYPNPATSLVTIKWDANNAYTQLEIFGLSGQILFSQEVRNQNAQIVDAMELGSGMYLVKLSGDKDSSLQRLIVE